MVRSYTIGMFRLLIIVFLGVVTPSLYVHAQFSGTDPLSVSISPEYPRPFETISVTPESTLIDLASAVVTVSVNGRLVSSDSGAQSIPVNVGGLGERTTITVTARTGGKTYTKSLIIRPADVALVVEPVSTSHPFYLGALGLAPEGRVRVIALADLRSSVGSRIPPGSLIYTWRFGNKILQSESGIGKNILTASGPLRYRDAQVNVTVTNADSSIAASASTLLQPVDPIVRIYPSAPLFGVDFDHALSGSYTLPGTEESFRGVPYFFGAAPTLAWSVGGQGSGGDKDVTVRTTGSGAGTASLSLTARLTQTRQSVTNTLNIVFGATKSTNLFGF